MFERLFIPLAWNMTLLAIVFAVYAIDPGAGAL